MTKNFIKAKPHILIIDDDRVFCAVLTEILNNAGYEISSVLSGQEGLDFLKTDPQKIDVVILDRIMPGLSGLDVLHKLCMIPVVRNIPVIMLTSHAETSHVTTAMTYGAFDTLYKPVEDGLLLRVITRALDKAASLEIEQQ